MAKNKVYDETTVKGRLQKYLKMKGMSQVEFANRMGVSATYVGAMRKGLSLAKLQQLSTVCPDLNRDWLVYGVGPMTVDPATPTKKNTSKYEVPLLPVAAYAGNLQNWSHSVEPRDCEKIMAPVPDADFAIRVSGDSMEPRFHDGTVIFIKKINEKAFIPWGNPMVIDTENGVLVKMVYPSEKGEMIEARSLNIVYPTLNVPTNSIYGLYRIVGSIAFYNTL